MSFLSIWPHRLRSAGNLPALVAAFSLALLLAGCGASPQQLAYDAALKKEPQLTAENTPALVAEYQQVIRLGPDSSWAKKAHERITALEARAKAEELHKAVFQEHGVD